MHVKVVRIFYEGQPSNLVLLRDVTDQVKQQNNQMTRQLQNPILNSITQNLVNPAKKAQEFLDSLHLLVTSVR